MNGSEHLSALVADSAGTTDIARDDGARRALLLIETGALWFAAEAGAVREVVARESLSRLPAVPDHILGMAMISGRLVPVLALDALAGQPGPRTHGGRLVVLHDGARELAIAAARTYGLLELALVDADRRASERVPWVNDQVRWRGSLVGVLDPVALIDTATRTARQAARRTRT